MRICTTLGNESGTAPHVSHTGSCSSAQAHSIRSRRCDKSVSVLENRLLNACLLTHTSFYVSKACSHSEQTLALSNREELHHKKNQLAASSQKMKWCLIKFAYSNAVHIAVIVLQRSNINDRLRSNTVILCSNQLKTKKDK